MRNFTPATTYDLLLAQFKALNTLCNNIEKEKQYWKQRCEDLQRESQYYNTHELDSQKAANEELTRLLEIQAERTLYFKDMYNKMINKPSASDPYKCKEDEHGLCSIDNCCLGLNPNDE